MVVLRYKLLLTGIIQAYVEEANLSWRDSKLMEVSICSVPTYCGNRHNYFLMEDSLPCLICSGYPDRMSSSLECLCLTHGFWTRSTTTIARPSPVSPPPTLLSSGLCKTAVDYTFMSMFLREYLLCNQVSIMEMIYPQIQHDNWALVNVPVLLAHLTQKTVSACFTWNKLGCW